MKKLIVLTLILISLVSCTESYLKNRFRVISFEAYESLDSNHLELKVNVEYYSDSTQSNLFSEGIEKGQDGSNRELVFFGPLIKESKSIQRCAEEPFENFIRKYNSKDRSHRGQRFDETYSLCNPFQKDVIKDIIMVFKDPINGQNDTLVNQFDKVH